MLDELVKQVRRLFSSKSNGGRLVYKLTDRLHYTKQVLLALSIALLIGYGQFREHFKCQGSEKLDSKTVTNHCWHNGTTTLDLRDDYAGDKSSFTGLLPHIGLVFQTNNNGKYEPINHNYMRSIWGLLILMAALSFMAQKKWSNIFSHEIIRALLQLPGYQELSFVKKAQEIKPYQLLISLKKPQAPNSQAPTTGNNKNASTISPSPKDSVIVSIPNHYEINPSQPGTELADLIHVNAETQPPTAGSNGNILVEGAEVVAKGKAAETNLDEKGPVELNNSGKSKPSHIRTLPPVNPAILKKQKGQEEEEEENDEVLYSKPKRQKMAVASVRTLQQERLMQLFQGHPIELLIGDQNEHNHTLDYYANQLIYLLIACRTSLSGSKMSELNLKYKLISYSIFSSCVTFLQFFIPWICIGYKYKLYGWSWVRAWLKYTLEQMIRPHSNVNSVDYELSSRIWPTVTQCSYIQYGLQGEETMTFQCSVPINELSGKLFMIFWWFIVINMIVELYGLLMILLCCISDWFMRRHFSNNYWTRAKKEAKLIATFNYRHSKLLNKNTLSSPSSSTRPVARSDNYDPEKANLEMRNGDVEEQMTFRQIFSALSRKIQPFNRFGRRNYRKPIVNKEDSNIYFLLYLLYLRLDKSEKKVEQIILMTSGGLKIYYDNLMKLEMENQIE